MDFNLHEQEQEQQLRQAFHEKMLNSDDMDIDQVVEVPDTPDRVVARCGTGRESGFRRDSESSLHGDFKHRDKNGLRSMDKPVAESRRTRGPIIRAPKRYGNLETTNYSNLNAFNSLENSSASQNAGLFRRMAVDGGYSHGDNHSSVVSVVRSMDKGKAICTGRTSGYQEGDRVFDFVKKNGYSEHRNAVSYGATEHILAEDKRRGHIAPPFMEDSSETFRNAFKGKEKIEENTPRSPGLATVHGEAVNMSIDSQHKAGEHRPSRSIRFKYPGKNKLVRNGCISPQNIAKAEKLKNNSENTGQNHAGNGVVNHPQSPVNLSDIVAEENERERVKGKAVLTLPSASKDRNPGFSSNGTYNGEANGISDSSKDAFGLDGWRSIRDRSRGIDNTMNDVATRLSRRTGGNRSLFGRRDERWVDRRYTGNGSGQYSESEFDLAAGQTATLSDPFLSEAEHSSGAPRADKALNKRLKKFGSSSRNHVDYSTSISEDSDVMFLGSSRESTNLRSSTGHHPQSQSGLGPLIDVDAFSPPAGLGPAIDADAFSLPNRRFTQSSDSTNNDDSEARARQVEADEILARELQEQLYHETPLVREDDIDQEFLAWVVQEGENGSSTSGARENESHPRGSVMSHLPRQPRLRTSQSRSNRTQNQSNGRGTQARVPSSSRMAQLRGRNDRQRPAVSARARNLHFPLSMDLDMRIDILEALEDAFGDLGAAEMDNHLFQIQRRDFNESDYEMLLMLDEHNHRHAGASANQINNLPLSVVQTENLEEPCAVCLEPPTVGEIIRHLPCLHKFHKDCIDPWLGRKSLCPVCKSSIT